MGTTMNRSAFEKLIAENIAWLEQQPRTLERDHIIDICRHAPDMYYGKRDEDGLITAVWNPARHAFAPMAPGEAPAPTPEALDLEAGKIIREVIQQHKHNVGWAKWPELSPGQQESWRIVAERFVDRLRSLTPPSAEGAQVVEIRPKDAPDAPPILMRIDPGESSPEDIANLFSALNDLAMHQGVSRLEFTIRGMQGAGPT